jgi:hypothetical protein
VIIRTNRSPHIDDVAKPGKLSIESPTGTVSLDFQDWDYQTKKVTFYDDFLGSSGIQTGTGSANWTRPTPVGTVTSDAADVADETNGVISLGLAATSEAESTGFTWGDSLLLKAGQGLIFETRVKLSVVPTGTAEVVFGLADDYNASADVVARAVWFKFDGSAAALVESDDNTTNVDDIATGVTVATTEWHIFRIDASDINGVKFFIDGFRVAAGTSFVIGANKLQPYFHMAKASGTGVGTLLVDYVRVIQNRV